MRILWTAAAVLALAGSALAAPNVTNATQKGSLLIWPDIRVDNTWNTIVRLQNDGSLDVDVKCYWMDGNKNRVDFQFTITKNQAIWFDAKTGNGTFGVNRFPTSVSNGFDNPDLISPGFVAETSLSLGQLGDFNRPYFRGLLACWAVDGGAQNQVKWNHLSGTATVFNTGQILQVTPSPFFFEFYEDRGAYEYNAYAFFVPTGLDQEPVGVAGTLNLNGVEYDSCPLYQIGQFTPIDRGSGDGGPAGQGLTEVIARSFSVWNTRLAIAGCSLNLNQDWTPVRTKLQFDIWNADEVKFTGAFECADSWHETAFADPSVFAPNETALTPAQLQIRTYALAGGPIDSAASNFTLATLATVSARYRVQGVTSTQCPGSVAVGVLGVQSTDVLVRTPAQEGGGDVWTGTTLAAAGKFSGQIKWDPSGVVPEGGIR